MEVYLINCYGKDPSISSGNEFYRKNLTKNHRHKTQSA